MTNQFPHYRVMERQRGALEEEWDLPISPTCCVLLIGFIIGLLVGKCLCHHK